MRKFLLITLFICCMFISACNNKNGQVTIEPTVEQTVEVIEVGE